MEPTIPAVPVPPANAKHPVSLNIPYPATSSRLLAVATIIYFIKALMIVPHYIVVMLLMFCAFIATVVGQFAVLFTGKYPRPLFALVKGALNWQARTGAYFLGLTDTYPPFGFETDDEEAAKKGLMWIGIPAVLLALLMMTGCVMAIKNGAKNSKYERSHGMYDRDMRGGSFQNRQMGTTPQYDEASPENQPIEGTDTPITQ